MNKFECVCTVHGFLTAIYSFDSNQLLTFQPTTKKKILGLLCSLRLFFFARVFFLMSVLNVTQSEKRIMAGAINIKKC